LSDPHANPHVSAWAVLCCLMPALSGCISYNTPGDLTFVSVREVDWRDVPELSQPNPLLGVQQRRGPLIKVEFSTNTNLFKFSRDNSYPIGTLAFFCDQSEGLARLQHSAVYSQGERVDIADDQQAKWAAVQEQLNHYIFFDVEAEAQPKAKPPRRAYDLRQDPEDVCFHLRGGAAPAPFGFRSNTVVVPKAAIAAALRGEPAGALP